MWMGTDLGKMPSILNLGFWKPPSRINQCSIISCVVEHRWEVNINFPTFHYVTNQWPVVLVILCVIFDQYSHQFCLWVGFRVPSAGDSAHHSVNTECSTSMQALCLQWGFNYNYDEFWKILVFVISITLPTAIFFLPNLLHSFIHCSY